MSINLSGWPYIFFIVVLATLTWLPAQIILQFDFLYVRTFFIEKLNINEKMTTLLIAVIFSFIWLLCFQIKKNS